MGAPRLVGTVWGLLILNTLGSAGAKTVVPIPRSLIQMVTMGALVAAFTLALALNLRLKVRGSAYLLLLSLLLVVSVLSSVHLESGFGALFRCARLALFVGTLWLLTRWWDGGDTFVRHHIRMYFAVLMSVAAGLVVSPGAALPELYGGRLVGALWPLTPPQIGQYAAVIIGLSVLLLLGGRTDRRSAALVVVPSLVLLALTHTRTATLGLLVGLTLAIVSLVLTSSSARRFFSWSVLTATVAAVGFSSLLQAWFLRGQSQENFTSLTGRAKVWDALLAAPRSPTEELFGVGLGDKSFAGLPIDNSWLAVYNEQGFAGVGLVAAFLVVLAAVALLRPPSLARACAIFLISYCAIASYTEAGLGDASPYLLHLALAGSLLAAPVNTAPGVSRLPSEVN
ncbi:membrane protein [Streptomyces acidiscabies]|uniref:O-antigen ligase domain-containing protein n=1 Tax=Streptomyces acidiscabies TaxID=42234 RepID=A0AAP6BHA8_9ACTN|nr:membrane protein [Streptomyces acidiscabies]MBP5942817.1 O-antigen ligase domain-containing protein [Streptomyces sp. LBUM 1476]MBZ3918049.1 O-antigen ligase domain-containing protein [Streptomyces acidiscabies]MDX2964707.1 O-antigen ligase domain-containing protein [Streptomyces acidiscabies]MDX3021907.1 O-antigen ligase domain-containing protein [Streptomyces acidiscabies]MDX3789564.1 O-antigen ligase domain-containing protein [Streptomyces acidiscabies]